MQKPSGGQVRWTNNLVGSKTVRLLFERLTEPVSRQFGLTRAETDVLAFLTNNPGLDTARDIVEYRNMSKANVSQAVELLMQKGFLTRQQDEKDRRQQHLRLTEAARPAAAMLAQARRRLDQEMFADFTDEEKALYRALSERVQHNAKCAMERI